MTAPLTAVDKALLASMEPDRYNAADAMQGQWEKVSCSGQFDETKRMQERTAEKWQTGKYRNRGYVDRQVAVMRRLQEKLEAKKADK